MIDAQGLIVILTGAGISKESGLDTFRDKGGVWSKVRLEDVATPEGFERNPSRVHDFYNARRQNLLSCQPNDAHLALARLEREWPGRVLVVTQNIDDLHERAGTTDLIHMHGELRKVRCQECEVILVWDEPAGLTSVCPRCQSTASLRPHVVWFGEMPLQMDEIYRALMGCSLFISIGTSGNVYPAAQFIAMVREQKSAHTIEVNMEPSQGASLFQQRIYGPATQTVPQMVDDILAGRWDR